MSKNEKLQQVYRLLERFQSYNEKKKKRFAKMGRKNVIKMISGLFQTIIGSWNTLLGASVNGISSSLGLLEYMYDEFSKKYGNVKLAEKKIFQILGSAYYHVDSHPKI